MSRINVFIDKSCGAPRINKDGVTVSRETEFSDGFENIEAQMVREFASKTNDLFADGPPPPPCWSRPSRASASSWSPPA